MYTAVTDAVGTSAYAFGMHLSHLQLFPLATGQAVRAKELLPSGSSPQLMTDGTSR